MSLKIKIKTKMKEILNFLANPYLLVTIIYINVQI